MSLLLPTPSSLTQAPNSKSAQQQQASFNAGNVTSGKLLLSTPSKSAEAAADRNNDSCHQTDDEQDVSLLTSAPSSCPSAYHPSAGTPGGTSLLSAPQRATTPSHTHLLLQQQGSDRHSSNNCSAAGSHVSSQCGSHQSERGVSPVPPAAAPTTPHMTPMGTPITAYMSLEELRQHRQFLHHQRTQVVAFEHELLHKFILSNTNKIQSVSRHDHKVMVKTLIAEAYRNDPNRRQNRAKWERIMRDTMREVDSKNSVLMSIAPDPYHGALAKLSSMLLHNSGVQYWTYRYWEEEMLRRRSVQQATLAQLRGKLFLDNPVVPSTKKFM